MSESIAAPRATESAMPAERLQEAGSDRAPSSDRVIAYTILRLSFSVNIMLHGVSRLLTGPSGFLTYLNHYFEHAPLIPKSFLPVFGGVLPPVETALGLLLL